MIQIEISAQPANHYTSFTEARDADLEDGGPCDSPADPAENPGGGSQGGGSGAPDPKGGGGGGFGYTPDR
jgi:hypothetical protein